MLLYTLLCTPCTLTPQGLTLLCFEDFACLFMEDFPRFVLRTYPALLWGLSPLILTTFPALLWGLSPLILRFFPAYFEEFPRFIFRTFPAYFELELRSQFWIRNRHGWYCVSNKSWLILYSNLPYKISRKG